MTKRQDRAKRIMRRVVIFIILLVIAFVVQQIIAHGWEAFVLRPPGTGATPGN